MRTLADVVGPASGTRDAPARPHLELLDHERVVLVDRFGSEWFGDLLPHPHSSSCHAARLHAAEAIVGRIGMQANDMVLLLAVLADAEGHSDKAAELILEMGSGRSPITIKCGEELAQRLGVDPGRRSAGRNANRRLPRHRRGAGRSPRNQVGTTKSTRCDAVS